MARYKRLSIYDAGGDLSKEWFVKYHYLKPRDLWASDKPEYQRFKISKTINCYHTLAERKQRAKVVMAGMKVLLQNYQFNPFKECHLVDRVEYSGYSLSYCIDKYLKHAESNLRHSTYRNYRDRLNLFKEWASAKLDGIMIYQVRKQDVFNFMTENQVSRKWKNKTYNHYLQAIHTFFEYYKANYDDYIKDNPCEHIKRLEVEEKGNRPYNDSEFTKTLEYTKVHYPYLYTYLRDIYYTCYRPGTELRNLRIYDINLSSRRMSVPAETAKGKKTQWIPIDDVLYEVLAEKNLDAYPPDFYVYGLGGKPAAKPIVEKHFNRHFKKVKEALNLHPDITMYSMKHTRVIHLVQDGEKLHDIIKLTRHKTLAELMNYLKDLGVVIGEQPNFKSRKI